MRKKIFCLIVLCIITATILAGCQTPQVVEQSESTASLPQVSIGWFKAPLNELSYFDKAGNRHTLVFTHELVMDNADLQARISSDLPLDKNDIATSHAWEILAILQDNGYVYSHSIPILLNHYSNGVWVFSYSAVPQEELENSIYAVRDEGIQVYISDIDGHVIAIFPDITKGQSW